jgi:transcriptional regulator with XRE-family HTH domain
MTPGERMRSARIKMKKTQVQAAADLGVSQPAYSEWESDVSNPRSDRIHAIAAYLHIKPEHLIPKKAA